MMITAAAALSTTSTHRVPVPCYFLSLFFEALSLRRTSLAELQQLLYCSGVSISCCSATQGETLHYSTVFFFISIGCAEEQDYTMNS